jgi:hypothetical protein
MKTTVLTIFIVLAIMLGCKNDDNLKDNKIECNYLGYQYYKGLKDTIGEMSGEYIMIGTDTANNVNTVNSFIEASGYFNNEYEAKTTYSDKYRILIVKLAQTKSCPEISKMMNELKKSDLIDFVHYTIQTNNCTNYYFETIGDKCVDCYGNHFTVSVKDTNDLTSFNNLVSETKTIIHKRNNFRREVFTINTDKHSKGDAWQMANEFFETGLFNYSSPSFFKVPVE